MSAGYYKDLWIHDSIKNKSVGQLTETIINDILTGINGIHAGFIKIAMSNPITPFEEKVLLAAAHAQLATGVAIDVHFDGHRAPAADRHHILDVLENEGVDLSRVYLSHCVPFLDLVDDYITMAERGCYLAFDMIGLEIRVDFDGELELPETLNALINAGYLDQIMISQDVCFSVCYVQNGGYGYGHILNNIVPELKSNGITDDQIHTIMVENPKQVFPIIKPFNTGECENETYTAASGTVTDNSGPSDYLNSKTCSKLIQPANCETVTLTFTEFNTEPGYDFLSIYDGTTTASPVLGNYSGNALPPVLTSTGGSMLIVFTSNYRVTAAGWSANYTGNTLKINPDSITVTPASGEDKFTVTSTVDWSIAESSGWFTAAKTDDTTITVIYNENKSITPRSAEIAVSGNGVTSKNIVVKQSGAIPGLSVSPESIPVSPESGLTAFSVASNIEWNVSENSDWLNATKTDAATLTVLYDENTSIDPRSAEITVGGEGVNSQIIVVIQGGVSPVLSISPISRSMSAASGSTSFAVASNAVWSVSESSDWLTATKADAATLDVIYDENTSKDSRFSEIIVTAAGLVPKSVYILQEGAVVSSVESSTDMPKMMVFPNPVSDKTWLTYPRGTVEVIEIYDPSGRLTMSLKDTEKTGKTEIDLSGLNRGFYMYRIIDKEGNSYNGKILKE
jgi:hypothetical protein